MSTVCPLQSPGTRPIGTVCRGAGERRGGLSHERVASGQARREGLDIVMGLGIRGKLLGSFGLVLAMTVGIGLLGLTSMSRLDGLLGDMYAQQVVGLGHVLSADAELIASGRDEQQAILAEDRAEIEKHAQASRTHLTAVSRHLDEAEKSSATDEDRRAIQAVRTSLQAVQTSREQVLTLALSGKDAEAVTKAAELRVAVDKVDAALLTIRDARQANAHKVAGEAQASHDAARLTMLGLLAVAIVVGVGVSLTIARSVVVAVNAIQRTTTSLADNCATWLADALRAVAEGDLSIKLTPVTPLIEGYGRDELGQLSATTNALRNKIVACIGAYEEGRTGLRTIVTQVRATADSVADTSLQLGQASNQTSNAVQHVTQAIQSVALGAQETSQSSQTSNAAVDQLAQVVESVARGAQEQARQIQGASTTTSQMAGRIDEVAENAQSVATASQQTRTSAEHGAKAVRETVAGTLDENLEQPTGRGIMLIRAYMSSVAFSSTGNRIEMTYRKPAPKA